MTNVEDISIMLESGAHEAVVGRELTLEERIKIAEIVKKPLGMHFFGPQLMSYSRRKHLDQYKEIANVDLDPREMHYLKEASRDEDYMMYEDTYGTHMYAPGVFSAIHAYPRLVEAGFNTLYFETQGMDVEDVLFVVRSLDLIEDYEAFEEIVRETLEAPINHGLLYRETEAHKKEVKLG